MRKDNVRYDHTTVLIDGSMNYFDEAIGYAVGSPPLVWTVSLTAEEAAKKYLAHCRADDKSIKTFAETGESITRVVISSYDPNVPLNDKALGIFLAGYRRGIEDERGQ